MIKEQGVTDSEPEGVEDLTFYEYPLEKMDQDNLAIDFDTAYEEAKVMEQNKRKQEIEDQ